MYYPNYDFLRSTLIKLQDEIKTPNLNELICKQCPYRTTAGSSALG